MTKRSAAIGLAAALLTAASLTACGAPRLPGFKREPVPQTTIQRSQDIQALTPMLAQLTVAAGAYDQATSRTRDGLIADELAWLARVRGELAAAVEQRLEGLRDPELGADDAERPALARSAAEDTYADFAADFARAPAQALSSALTAETVLLSRWELALQDPQISAGTKNFLRRTLPRVARGRDRIVDLQQIITQAGG